MGDDKAAKEMFHEIDGNGGGVILLDEWSGWLKAQELAHNTLLGQTLG